MKNPRPDHLSWEKIFSAERRADFAYTLSKVQWDIFSTLTFKNPVPRNKVAWGLAFRWLRELSKVCAVPYNHLLIALRGELGEEKGRFHFHCLVGGTTTRNSITLAHQADYLWRGIANGAIAQSRPYDRSLNGAEYVCKALGANQYELNKYNLADCLTLSHSVVSVIRAMDAKAERQRIEDERKNRQASRALHGLPDCPRCGKQWHTGFCAGPT